jgi:hypothetical protein
LRASRADRRLSINLAVKNREEQHLYRLALINDLRRGSE